MYSLDAPLWNKDDVNNTLRKLLKEVMGYCDDEIKALEAENFCRIIAKNLTIEQAKQITEIFGDNGFTLYLHDSNDKLIGWKKNLNMPLQHNPPKDHYCDKPLLSESNRIDVSVPEKVEPYVSVKRQPPTKPQVECPYCHSTNTKKISGMSKAGSVALFGIFALGKTSKQWHCNECKSDF